MCSVSNKFSVRASGQKSNYRSKVRARAALKNVFLNENKMILRHTYFRQLSLFRLLFEIVKFEIAMR